MATTVLLSSSNASYTRELPPLPRIFMTLYLLPLMVSILSLLEGGGIVALGVGSAGVGGGLIGVTV